MALKNKRVYSKDNKQVFNANERSRHKTYMKETSF